ncbi:hypothetical protein PUN28_014609 [Cardiocondyla obscurior]|uniref:Uncharacterized protein n=1 Tax=Cardiocondyla obscurior TaxID=286306 RepID=A0AAW2F6W0_9HYME
MRIRARLCVRARRVFIRYPSVRPPAHRQQRTRHIRSLCRRRRLYRVSRAALKFPRTARLSLEVRKKVRRIPISRNVTFET